MTHLILSLFTTVIKNIIVCTLRGHIKSQLTGYLTATTLPESTPIYIFCHLKLQFKFSLEYTGLNCSEQTTRKQLKQIAVSFLSKHNDTLITFDL